MISGWRQRKIPQSGYLNGNQEISFSFHGIGCLFESKDLVIDIDFDKNGGCEGFDLWRVALFIRENSKFKGSVFKNRDVLETVFKELEDSGEIFCPKSEIAKHLYYLTQS